MVEERTSSVADVVIVGGSVAGLESLLALRDLAGDRARLTLVTPDADFVDRPMTVAEPFGLGAARRHPLGPIAADAGAALVPSSVREVRTAERRVLLRGGGALGYDKLVLAPGARSMPAFDHAITIGVEGWGAAVRELVNGVEGGAVRRVAFVAPTSIGWTLPLYELALMTGRAARRAGVDAELFLVTREPRPLAVFGERAGANTGHWLRSAGVQFMSATVADVQPGVVALEPGGRVLPVDAVIALPLVRGPGIEGVPADGFGFIPVDPHGRVRGLDGVYAAGDAADFPVKQGGLAAQQADAVAAHIAADLGAPVTAAPFSPVLRGMLFTGADPYFLLSRDLADRGEGTASLASLWWPPTKIAGRYLSPYLLGDLASEAFGPRPTEFVELDVGLRAAELPEPRPEPAAK